MTDCVGYSLFCLYADDVRQEVTGKTLMVGVYQGGMNVAGILPVTLPQLFVIANLTAPRNIAALESLAIKVEWGDKTLFEISTPQKTLKEMYDGLTEDAEGLVFQMTIGVQPFVVDKPGKLRVSALVNGDMVVKGNGLRVVHTEPPVVAPEGLQQTK